MPEKIIDKDFIERKLCKRIESILRSYVSHIEFFLKYNKDSNLHKPPEPLAHMFEFYVSSEVPAVAIWHWNKGVDKVPSILEEIQKKFGLPFDVIDTKNMSLKERKQQYQLCAHRAMTSRLYGRHSGFSIRDNFSDVDDGTASYFGGRTPALITYSEDEIDFVLPHDASWRAYEFAELHSVEVTIYDFLTTLKLALKTEMKDTLADLKRAKAKLAEFHMHTNASRK